MTRTPRGKNAHPDYVALVARIPKRLRADFQKYLIDAETDTNIAIERLVRGILSGTIALADLPAAVDPADVNSDQVPRRSAPSARSKVAVAEDEGDVVIDESKLFAFDPIDLADMTGEDFKALRMRLGYTSGAAMSRALGLSRTTWGQYERGANTPGEDVRRRLRALLQHHGMSEADVGDQA